MGAAAANLVPVIDDVWVHAPVLATMTRSGLVESRHRGAVVGLDDTGAVVLRAGPIGAPVFGRSTNKPLQAVGVLRAGAELDDEELALACASHSGEPEHLAVVRRVLARIGLDQAALGNVAGLPLFEPAAVAILRVGGSARPITHNCSGKHAGMLAACVAAGWPTADYLDPGHPLQRTMTATVAELAGEGVAAVGVDGCGAPVHAVSTLGLARAFARLAGAPAGTPEARVAHAMRAHPHLVGGTGRDVTRLLAGTPGLVAKDGAEGVYAAAMADGRAVAVKIDDGAGRARTPVLVAALARLGVDVGAVADLAIDPVLGGGRVVGEVRATLPDAGRGGPPDR